MSDNSAVIAALNDTFRKNFADRRLGKTYITRGVEAFGPDFVARVMTKVQTFNTFTVDNDPYGEQDFGAFEVDSVRLFFKIDYFDKAEPDLGAENPSDATSTERVLTIMLSDEY